MEPHSCSARPSRGMSASTPIASCPSTPSQGTVAPPHHQRLFRLSQRGCPSFICSGAMLWCLSAMQHDRAD
eukprot:35761-Eustigmatos_ZCMA.PRE.1